MTDPIEQWHIKKEIQIGHLLTTFTVAISAVFYINKIEQRVAVIESQIQAQQDANVVTRQQLEKINDKLDRLIERSVK